MTDRLKSGLVSLLLLATTSPLLAQIEQSEPTHSPHKASFYSAILPGLGQAYNKKFVKIPIIYAGAGALIYAISFNSKYFKNTVQHTAIGS